jgi:hypothetical protein
MAKMFYNAFVIKDLLNNTSLKFNAVLSAAAWNNWSILEKFRLYGILDI